MAINLKSTGQEVFKQSWMATSKRPWSDKYERVLRPFTGSQLLNAKSKAEVLIVAKSNLIFS